MISKLFSTLIGRRISPNEFELSETYLRIMNISSAITFPCWFMVNMEIENARHTYIFPHKDESSQEYTSKIIKTFNPCSCDYVAIGIKSLVCSVLTGFVTPIVLYSSPIWIPKYFLDNHYHEKYKPINDDLQISNNKNN